MTKRRPASRIAPQPPSRVATCLLLVALAACGGRPAAENAAAEAEAWRGSVVVIACSVLRADHVGALGGPAGLTPELDRFAAEAAFATRAVAASSDPLVALASFFTGVTPWQHQVLGPLYSNLQPGLPTLASRFADRGYDTVLFSQRAMRAGQHGLERGFSRSEPFSEKQALRELPLFDDFPRFYWLVLPDTDLPWQDASGRRIEAFEVYADSDPSRPLSPDRLASYRQLYREQVRAADAAIGRLLGAFRASPAWADSVVVVTGLVGFELGEHGQTAYAQNLGRETLEVPMLIKLPANAGPLRATSPVPAAGLWATLAELADGTAPAAPARAPSYAQAAQPPAVSELYHYDGANLFSALLPGAPGEPPVQVLWKSRYAPPDPRFYDAQVALVGGRSGVAHPLAVIEGDRPIFESAPPLRGQPSLRAELWLEEGGTRPVPPESIASLGARLERALRRFADADRAPLEESRLPQPGEVKSGVTRAAEKPRGR